jgi:hypothetical protein
MAYNPGVPFFIPFHELDPSEQSQCIYFTQKRARCLWTCQESHNRRAIEIHQAIIASPSESISLDLLQEYVLCNCCISGKARHRDRIEDVGLLTPLAQRWQDEIQRQAADQSNETTVKQAFRDDVLIHNPYATPATSPSRHTTIPYTPIDSPSCYTPSKSSASSTPSEQSSPMRSSATKSTVQPSRSETRYDLCHRRADIPTKSISDLCTSIFHMSLSEFRPHIAEPVSSDFVSGKILEPLRDRDFETGSLYMFDRTSSPGHVKIGWTASSVKRRLEDWSKCGYTPNLLFSVHSVPHAQRAETLTHHELIKEWRRERMCKAEWCRKSHQEWFEISKERAAQVLGEWAEFIRIAEPYDLNGSLKSKWKEYVETMAKTGQIVTAKTCLEHYKASLDKEATFINELLSLRHTQRIEEQDDFGNRPTVGGLENREEALKRVHSRRVEQQTLCSQITPMEIILPKAEIPLKSIPVFKENLSSRTEQLFDTKSQSRTQFAFTARPPSKTQFSDAERPSSQPQFSFAVEPPFQTQFSFADKLPTKPQFSFAVEPPSKTQFSFAEKPPSELQFSFANKPPPETQFSFAGKLLTKPQFSFVTEPPSKTQFSLAEKPPSKPQFSFTAKPLDKTQFSFEAKPLSETQPSFTAELPSKTQFCFADKPPSKLQFSFSPKPPPATQSSFTAELPSKTKFSFVEKPPSKPQFSFSAKPPSNIESFSKIGSLFMEEPLIATELLSQSKPMFEKVPASKRTPVNRELLSEQIPLPSPLLRPIALLKEPIPHQDLQCSVSVDIGKLSKIHVTTNSNTNVSVAGSLFSPKINLLVSPPAPALPPTTNTLSAASDKDSPQINVHIIAEDSDSSQPLNSSDCSSDISPSQLSAISVSPRVKSKLVSKPPTPLGIDTEETLLYSSTGEQEEVDRTLSLVMQRQQNVEWDGETGDVSAFLGCAGQTCEKEIEFKDQNENTFVENEAGTGLDSWDEDETLVENQVTMRLEMAALKIFDGLCNGNSTREANGAPKGLNGLKVLEDKVLPAVERVL